MENKILQILATLINIDNNINTDLYTIKLGANLCQSLVSETETINRTACKHQNYLREFLFLTNTINASNCMEYVVSIETLYIKFNIVVN